jgi:hypothetical protein
MDLMKIHWNDFGLHSANSQQGRLASSSEHRNKYFGLPKDEEFLNQVNEYYLLKENYAPWSKKVIKQVN